MARTNQNNDEEEDSGDGKWELDSPTCNLILTAICIADSGKLGTLFILLTLPFWAILVSLSGLIEKVRYKFFRKR